MKLIFLLIIKFLRRISRRCPAIMFAASRTDRVIGRIMLLIISIRTIIGRRGEGVPTGTRWINILFMDAFIVNNMRDAQMVNAAGRVITMWAVYLNTKGLRAIKLLMDSIVNNPVKMITLSFFTVFCKLAFTSVLR
jgi:hypothetical protein